MKKAPWIVLIAIFGVLNLILLVVILLSPTKQQLNALRDIMSEIDQEETTKPSERETKKEETTTAETPTEPATEEVIVREWVIEQVPVQDDFSWIDNATVIEDQAVEITDVLAKCGPWKAEIWYYDSNGGLLATEICTVNLDLTNGTVTFSPVKILYNGDMEWFDETGDAGWSFSGSFGQSGNWEGNGAYGQLSLGTFWQYQGTQYGESRMFLNTGNTGEVYFIRP